MNNSKLALDVVNSLDEEQVDIQPMLVETEARLVRIIEAIQGIAKTKEWSTLKTEIFDNLQLTLERELAEEAKKKDPDALKLNRLAGQLKWAEKYSDFTKLEAAFRVELTRVRNQIQ